MNGEVEGREYNFLMFDGLDTGPLCCAPFVAIFVGITVYYFGIFSVTRIKNKDVRSGNGLKSLVTIASIVTLPIICISSVALGIGSAVPSPWIKPSTFNISGEWGLAQCTTERFAQRWGNASEHPGYIKFNIDKTFEIEELPVLWGLSNHEHKYDGQYISGTGTWYVGETSGRIGNKEWILVLQFNEINQEKYEQLIGFYFDGHSPPYTLAYMDNINLVHLTQKISPSYYLCFPWN
jgi:hypothetical protein